jgi:Pyruvate/2-oxoacid:ferredoxin oxidoreductase gamma subunit
MKQIMVSGVGGQSVRVISHALALALQQLGFYVTLLYDYDSVIRGGKIVGYLKFDDQPIDSPHIDKADILLMLADKEKGLVAQRTICDSGLCSDEEIPFGQLGVEKFGRAIFGNMIALGHLLRMVDVDINNFDLHKALPKAMQEDNIRAVQAGFDLNLWED